MNRGRRREDIFLASEDYLGFIKILQEAAECWHLKVSAYCLMPNHYHLLVNTPDGNLSRCMRHINSVYTQRFNRRHNVDGQLFRGRYKAVLVEADSHLLEVLRYIHRNPLRAGMVKELKEFPWSSHHGYLSRAEKWAWLHKDFLLSMLSENKSGRVLSYRNFVSLVESAEVDRFYALKNLPSVFGGETFKDWLQDRFKHLKFREEIPESRQLAISAPEIIAKVCGHFQVTPETVLVSRRGNENLPRNVAIYLVRLVTRETMPEVGKYFGITNYSTVGSVVERMKQRKQDDRNLRKHLEKLLEMLFKSQERT